MATDNVSQFELHMARAEDYHRRALWQEKLRALQSALEICEEPGFPQAGPRKQDVLFEIGGIRRRFGQHTEGIRTLQEALHVLGASAAPLQRAKILGELGVIYRHDNQYARAKETFREQYELAYRQVIEGEAEMCRALGNEGMAAYNLYGETRAERPELLREAFEKLEARVVRAQELHDRLVEEDPTSRYVGQTMAWKTIGMDRLTLCYIAARETAQAVRQAEESQRLQSGEDPTVTGFSKFFYGNALWHDNQKEAALKAWGAPVGVCTSAHSLCKEPADEHAKYLELMASAGVDFDTYDEQGFSPLDYAVLSDNADARKMVNIILDAFRAALRSALEYEEVKTVDGGATSKRVRLSDDLVAERVEKEIANRLRLANIRRFYRAMLQEHLRPELRKEGSGSVARLRQIYADLLMEDPEKAVIFDWFKYIPYEDFKARARLPLSTDIRHGSSEKLAKRIFAPGGSGPANEDLFIIFFSYRWLGGGSGPDNREGVQYQRMINAVDAFLQRRRDLQPQNIGLWLDCTCIMQEDPQVQQRGIDALPFAVTQCDAMISLLDESYYTRAWCAVEVNLVQELIKNYDVHTWWEHILHDPKKDRLNGTLKSGNRQRQLDISRLKLTQEEIDRPKVEFLLRQSKLLGRDDA